jgi:2-keto-4-pentenoate hydratase/2-oxohepta-3-ene-1,7-dioic acid hydratase in catechol pathway
MTKAIVLPIALLALLAAAIAYALFRPLGDDPSPANFHCYDLGQGAYVPLNAPTQAFGVGLTYAAHIREAAPAYDSDAPPPVFEKSARAMVRDGAEVPYPSSAELIAAADAFEPGLGETLRADFPDLSPLLDYEVEMGFVLLEEIDPSRLDDPAFAPRLGYFVANDLSARSMGVLGAGRPNPARYWGMSKSFPGFMPLEDSAWAPAEALPNGIPCVELRTVVNGEVRQQQSTSDLIYTPAEMLHFIHAAFPDAVLSKGTVVLTGTPGGVAMSVPRWKMRLASLLRWNRFQKLGAALSADRSRFVEAGDRVTVQGEGLGEVTVTIAAPP